MSQQKIALITGANRGIGLETARQLGKSGVHVIVAARKLEAAAAAVNELRTSGIEATPLQLDVTSDADRKAAAQFIDTTFGRLDILVNNAGIAPKESLMVPKVLDTPSEEFHEIFETNLFSVVHLTKELLPLIRKSPAGRIVNLSSILGSIGLHAQENSPIDSFRILSYNASKAALNVFTVNLAAELRGTNIKVNSAHPGWVQTDMGGAEAPMAIEDGAKTSVSLALAGEDGPNGRFIHMGEELPW